MRLGGGAAASSEARALRFPLSPRNVAAIAALQLALRYASTPIVHRRTANDSFSGSLCQLPDRIAMPPVSRCATLPAAAWWHRFADWQSNANDTEKAALSLEDLADLIAGSYA